LLCLLTNIRSSTKEKKENGDLLSLVDQQMEKVFLLSNRCRIIDKVIGKNSKFHSIKVFPFSFRQSFFKTDQHFPVLKERNQFKEKKLSSFFFLGLSNLFHSVEISLLFD
jgi:hypothetical protein